MVNEEDVKRWLETKKKKTEFIQPGFPPAGRARRFMPSRHFVTREMVTAQVGVISFLHTCSCSLCVYYIAMVAMLFK